MRLTSILLHDGPHAGSIVGAVVAPEGDMAAYHGWVDNVRVGMISRRFTVSSQGRRWP